MKKSEEMKGYFVFFVEDDFGVAVVAQTAKEAKKLAYNSGWLDDGEWIDLRARWIRTANIIGLEKGVLNNHKDALKRGFYGYIEGYKCDGCNREEILYESGGRAICWNCMEAKNGGTPV